MKFILYSLFFTFSAVAQDFVFDKEKGRAVPSFIGQMKLLKGKVMKKNEEGITPVNPGERFKKNDILVTSDKSYAKVLMIDDSLISVGPQSELRFDEIDFKDKSDRKMTLTLIKGQLTGDIKNKAKEPGDIKFKTTFTTMGIRGTYILMNAQKVKSLDVAEYALLSGNADVIDSQNAKFELKKGGRITIINDSSKNSSDHEEKELLENDFKNLQGLEVNEENDFKPFLPLFKHPDLDQNSVLQKYFTRNETSPNEAQASSTKREDEKPHWKDNLQKLNEKLKEQQNNR